MRFAPLFFSLMKFGCFLLFLTSFAVVFSASPAATSTSTKAKKKAANTSSKGQALRKKAAKGSRTKGVAAVTRQQTPTPERYKEIQQALAAKGYLKSEPNGVWDAESSDALKQYQTEHNLSPTGKLSAASLISLGLGGSATSPAPEPSSAELPPPTQP